MSTDHAPFRCTCLLCHTWRRVGALLAQPGLSGDFANYALRRTREFYSELLDVAEGHLLGGGAPVAAGATPVSVGGGDQSQPTVPPGNPLSSSGSGRENPPGAPETATSTPPSLDGTIGPNCATPKVPPPTPPTAPEAPGVEETLNKESEVETEALPATEETPKEKRRSKKKTDKKEKKTEKKKKSEKRERGRRKKFKVREKVEKSRDGRKVGSL